MDRAGARRPHRVRPPCSRSGSIVSDQEPGDGWKGPPMIVRSAYPERWGGTAGRDTVRNQDAHASQTVVAVGVAEAGHPPRHQGRVGGAHELGNAHDRSFRRAEVPPRLASPSPRPRRERADIGMSLARDQPTTGPAIRNAISLMTRSGRRARPNEFRVRGQDRPLRLETRAGSRADRSVPATARRARGARAFTGGDRESRGDRGSDHDPGSRPRGAIVCRYLQAGFERDAGRPRPRYSARQALPARRKPRVGVVRQPGGSSSAPSLGRWSPSRARPPRGSRGGRVLGRGPQSSAEVRSPAQTSVAPARRAAGRRASFCREKRRPGRNGAAVGILAAPA
jgi:hypothetical protein